MNDDSALKQQLLELEYGLLSEAEEQTLRQRIAEDSHVAELYQKTIEWSKLLGDAARLDVPIIALPSVNSPELVSATTVEQPAVNGRRGGKLSRLFGLAAGLLLMGTVTGFLFPWVNIDRLDRQHLALSVRGPSELQAGVPTHFSVTAQTATDKSIAVPLVYDVLNDAGESIASGPVETGGFAVPALTKIEPGVEIRILDPQQSTSLFAYKPVVKPEELRTQLSLEQESYSPGDEVRFQSVTLSRYRLVPREGEPVSFALTGPQAGPKTVETRELAETQATSSNVGMATGTFTLPENAVPGTYSVIARNPDNRFPEVWRDFEVKSPLSGVTQKLVLFGENYQAGDRVTADYKLTTANGEAMAAKLISVNAGVGNQWFFREQALTSATGTHRIDFALPNLADLSLCQLAVTYHDVADEKTVQRPISVAKQMNVDFFPLGGHWSRGKGVPVYLRTHDGQGQAVPARGYLTDQNGRQLTDVETTAQGLGRFEVDLAGAQESPATGYALNFFSPVRQQVTVPVDPRPSTLTVQTASIQDGDTSLALTVQSQKAGVPVTVTITCRGATVATKEFVCGKGDNTLALPLPGEAVGVIELTVVDRGTDSPAVAWTQKLFRRPNPTLNIELQSIGDTFAWGDNVELGLRVTDAAGKGVPALVEVNTSAIPDGNGSERMVGLQERLLFDGLDVGDDDRLISHLLAGSEDSAKALDLFLGTAGTPENKPRVGENTLFAASVANPSAQPAVQTLFDNRPQVRQSFVRSVENAAQQLRQRFSLWVVLTGGVLVVCMLLLRFWGQLRLSPLQLTTALACVLVGSTFLFELPTARPPDQMAFHDTTLESAPPGKSFDSMTRESALAEPTDSSAEPQSALAETPTVESAGSPSVKSAGSPSVDLTEPRQQMEAKTSLPLKAEGLKQEQEELVTSLPVVPAPTRALSQQSVISPAARAVDDRMKEKVPPESKPKELPAPAPSRSMGYGSGIDAPLSDADRFKGGAVDSRGRQLQSRSRDLAKRLPEAVEPMAEKDQAALDVVPATGKQLNQLITVEPEGTTKLQFRMPRFPEQAGVRILARGNSVDGRFGSIAKTITAAPPIQIDSSIPPLLTAGDQLGIPINVSNRTAGEMDIQLDVLSENRQSQPLSTRTYQLAANQSRQDYYFLDVASDSRFDNLAVVGKTGTYSEQVDHPVQIDAAGFPQSKQFAGSTTGPVAIPLGVPADVVPGSHAVTVRVFPTVVAEIRGLIDDLEKQPHADFDSFLAITSVHLLSLEAQQKSTIVNPEAISQSRAAVEAAIRDINKYLSADSQGFGLFGGGDAQPLLTARGLEVLRQVRSVTPIDEKLFERLSRAASDGVPVKPNGVYQSESAAATQARLYFHLLHAGIASPEIDRWLAEIQSAPAPVDDLLQISIAAHCLVEAGNVEPASRFLQLLHEKQQPDGSLLSPKAGIPEAQRIEATAWAAWGWLRVPQFRKQGVVALEWLRSQRNGDYGFGSPQTNVIAARALAQLDSSNGFTNGKGSVRLVLDDRIVGESLISNTAALPLEWLLDAKLLQSAGELLLDFDRPTELPYTVSVAYNRPAVDSGPATPLVWSVKMADKEVALGDSVTVNARVENVTNQPVALTRGVVKLPAGLAVAGSTLTDPGKKGPWDFCEVAGRDVTFYWETIEPGQVIDWNMEWEAKLPGIYSTGGSWLSRQQSPGEKVGTAALSIRIPRP